MQRVGSRYVLRAPIGRGSTGQVWRGDTVPAGQPVAIKVLDQRLVGDPQTVARFVQERSILTGVRSAHLVRVLDLVAERDTLAIVMDLVDGVDLRQHLLRVGTLAPGLAAELIGQVLGALSAVHRAGIVHRDIKPGNILLDLADAQRPRAVLTDFGIARIVAGPAGRPATLAGTLGYLAPEVLRTGEAGPAADLYATGVVLYELLSGRVPFAADDPAGLLQAQEAAPPRPIPGLPVELQAVLAQLLARQPGDRPGSAAEARQALAKAAVEVRGLTALPSLGDAERYDGPTIPPGLVPAIGHRRAPAPTMQFDRTAATPAVGLPVALAAPALPGQRAGAPTTEDDDGAHFAAADPPPHSRPPTEPPPSWPDPPSEHATGEPRTRRRRPLLIAALAGIALAAALVALYAFRPAGEDQAGARAVTPRPAATAPAVAPSLAPAPVVPISTADPTPSRTAKARPVRKKARPATVPRVVGMPRPRALAALRSAGLTGTAVSYGCFEGRKPGRVAAQTPAGGTRITPSTRVSLSVEASNCARVPRVVGAAVGPAVAELRAVGFRAIYPIGGRGDPSARRVVGQSLPAGSLVRTSTPIVLVVGGG